VDGDKNKAISSKLGIQGFPTFKLIVDGKVTDYNGGRDAKSLAGAVMSEMAKVVKNRMEGGSKSNSGSNSKSSSSGGNNKGASEPGGGKHVITGTASNFDTEVINSVDPVLVEFYGM
jgi:thioredoxin-like negative regulator of GroEL